MKNGNSSAPGAKIFKALKKRRQLISNIITYALVIIAYMICQDKIANGEMSRSLRGQMVPICVYIAMAVSLNLTVGISGELSLGHAGFMSVGAFTGVVVSAWLLGAFQVENTLVRLLAALVAGGVTAGIAGFLIGIPVLRLRGDYLAIVTLAFGEIIYSVIKLIYVSMDNGKLAFAFNNADLPGKFIIKGPTGVTNNPKIATFAVGVGLIIFTLFVVLNLVNSRSGRAIKASRDNRIAAEAMGVNVTKYKMMAFVTSAFLAGMAGALYGMNYSTFKPDKFKFDTSILILVFVVLGGIGNIRGSIIAAAILTLLPELLREFNEYRMLIYAIVLIIMMLVTNNPFIKSLVSRLIPKRREQKKEAGVQ